MSTILLSVKPKYAAQIFAGTKLYEFRRRIARKKITSLVIYATAPVSAVIGEAAVVGCLAMSPEQLWDAVKMWAGISQKDFFHYFSSCKIAYAYCLGKTKRYLPPVSLSEYGIQYPPQSFAYID